MSFDEIELLKGKEEMANGIDEDYECLRKAAWKTLKIIPGSPAWMKLMIVWDEFCKTRREDYEDRLKERDAKIRELESIINRMGKNELR